MFVLAFKMLVSFSLVFVMMFHKSIPFTLNILHLIPIVIVLFSITFAISTFLLHFGIFIDDLGNLMKAFMRLLFYMSGIIYSITDRLPVSYAWILLDFNPIAVIADALRTALLYGSCPNYLLLGIWFVVSCIVGYVGIRIIQKHENSYAKVI